MLISKLFVIIFNYLQDEKGDEKRVDQKAAQVEKLIATLKRTGRLVEADFENVENDENNDTKNAETFSDELNGSSSESNYDATHSDLESNDVDDLPEKFEKLECKEQILEEDYDLDNILRPVKCEDSEEGLVIDSGNEAEEENSEEDDDEGWITPGNTNNNLNIIKFIMSLIFLQNSSKLTLFFQQISVR